jgi:hypothetical protein
MTSLHPQGSGTRRNAGKRKFVGEHLKQIEYRTIAAESRAAAKEYERRELWSNRKKYKFPT